MQERLPFVRSPRTVLVINFKGPEGLVIKQYNSDFLWVFQPICSHLERTTIRRNWTVSWLCMCDVGAFMARGSWRKECPTRPSVTFSVTSQVTTDNTTVPSCWHLCHYTLYFSPGTGL
ncbi:hypothetical protein SKAU_G00114940 [Synaphobranchus kaupii]|uniref:Uncharacterized protein n=1 Tax=Synaphobranchus kaupii TaxID=118154 RepID=A0A9Q1FN51_SYNKA|nr:hypothetical protein SKAU_G00114940 [Synaphobranchus kaupii]